jgi:very-short-patch-repair endonuclease
MEGRIPFRSFRLDGILGQTLWAVAQPRRAADALISGVVLCRHGPGSPLTSGVMRRISDIPSMIPRPTRGHRSRVSEEKKEFAKRLRRNPTKAFDLLWQQLRKYRTGAKFRRRAILYGWVLDFWCPSARVAVEIDYPSDVERATEHRHRDQVLARRGIEVLRFEAERVYMSPEQVAREITLVVSNASRPAVAPSELRTTSK